MEIVTSVVGKVAEFTIVPIGRQASYLIFYKSNFKMLDDHIKDLDAACERMKHSVEQERRNGKEIERDVLNWFETVNEVTQKATQLQNDPRRANARCSAAWPFPNLISRHQLSRKATKIAKDVIQAQGKGIFNRVGFLPIQDGVASSSATRGDEKYETRELLKEKIVEALKDPNSCNIGVYGLGGVGKTTLVEEVSRIAKQHKLFDEVVTTHVSQNPDLKTIQGEIADLLGLRFDEETIPGRAHRLRHRIKMEKNILVILDDIWNVIDLKKVGIPLVDEHNGCKLLMTSRNQDVLVQMDVPEDFTFKLELMSEKETWSLFQFMAGDVVNNRDLKDVAIQVAQKCAGLPLSIVTVARAMKNKRDVHYWKDALNKLQCNNHEGVHATTNSALELSYNSLESDEVKALFLIFALMPNDDVEYYLKVAMGLDILTDVKTIDDARNKHYAIINSLEARCLLLESKTSGKIKMHAVVRDLGIFIARRDKHAFLREFADMDWPTNHFLIKCTQIILHQCHHLHELPQRIDCPSIKFFYLNSTNRSLEIPDTFFEGMQNLTVLDLTSLNLPSLPTSFRFLTDLKSLCLDDCILENMDAIEALQNLEILRLWQSSMIMLPREIGRLTQLKMLDLSHSGIEVVPPNLISSLTKLEELYMGDTSINWADVNSTVQNENASIAELQMLPNLTTLELQIRETWMLPRDLQLMFEKLKRYKIAIGDVWEWSDIEDGTLKTLMLKLGANTHLEHIIKALIKSVENLYLDDVDGIQNVLYQLNGEGFPYLKHLHVQNNANMKHIVDSKERNQIHVSFPILETLVLDSLTNLEHICRGPISATSFGSLTVIKVKNCFQLKYLFSFTMVKELSHLSQIEVCHCNSMKEIVLEDNNSSANNEKIEFLRLRSLTLEHLETLDNFFSNYLTHSTTIQKSFFNAQVAFPNLDTLKLNSLNLSKIWGDYSMYNLTSLIVENCGGLMYLFSSTVVGSFKNLKHLEISNCPLMEEVIAKEEGNNPLDEVPFSKLEKIILKDMVKLKTIWHHQFESLKSLEVNNCEKIVVVFPSSIQTTYNKLETLEVTNCAFVEEIFELTFNCVEGTSHLKEVTLYGLPKLKKIWSKDPQKQFSFQNLTIVRLKGCESLEYLLPLSVATRCSHLKELTIENCASMNEIVAEEKESRLCASPIFEFNQLNTLMLWNLNKLKCFYVGKHTLSCPSLRKISVFNCSKLNLYRNLSTNTSKSSFQYDKLSVITQPPFLAEEVIPNLEELRIGQKDADMILQAQNSSALFTKLVVLSLEMYENEEATFPYWLLINVHKLEQLAVQWSCFKKLFQDEREISEKTLTRIKSLLLNGLPKLQHICEEGSQIDPILEFLEQLLVSSCSSLTNLLPSSVTLNHLVHLEITCCNGLKSLITTPTAQSLVKLTTLKVRDCKSLEEIITGEESVEIAFISLHVLVLECLPSLNKFCSSKFFLKFPLLEKVILRECPYMKIFSEGNTSTPILRKVKIAENEEEWLWKRNLNDTIKKMFEDKVAFSKFKYLALSDHPVLKDLWYGQVDHQTVFCNLKHIVAQRCDFLSHVLFPSNVVQVLYGLEKLEVYNCDSLEAIFDVKGMKSNDSTLIKQSCQLKTLTLSCLPNLKHIWNEDPHEIVNFGNICSVDVSSCQSLLYIFSLPLCQDLGNLEMLKIDSCGVEDIVAMKEGSMEISFNFPQLNALVLISLTNLKSFYQGKHTLECPSLKTLNVYCCETLRMFSFNNLDLQQPNENSQQALFSMEKLSTNLEDLSINAKDAFIMLNGYSQENICHKIKILRLQRFDETPIILLNDFHATFPNLTTLSLCNSSFEKLFPSNGTAGNLNNKLSKLIKELWLCELENIKYIWHEDFPLDHSLLQHLEGLSVWSCPSLINLVPSSTSFTNMTSLIVNDCKELVYLITSSTAKSLVQLRELKIMNCEKMLDVVKIDDEKVEEDVIFENLETLKFISLLSLRSFSNGKQTFIFPSLVRFVVKSCPQMKNFSLDVTEAPYLTGIEVADKNIRWKGDLNTTIEQLFIEKVAFSKFKYLALSDHPELKDLWYGQVDHQNVFGNLKHLVVQRCDSLSPVLFPSNVVHVLHGLEKLEVNDCDSLEVIFDVKGMKSNELILIKQYSQLKTLTLSCLPNLKHIWNEDPHEILNFGNLCSVNVSLCQSLLYIFSLLLCQDLGNLEILKIRSCGVEDIVAMKEGSMEINFNFPQLNTLALHRLSNLKSFYQGKHTLECPSLKTLNVYRCETLRMFSFNNLNLQQPDEYSHQALFSMEKLSTNLEELAINASDAFRMLNDHCQENFFPKIRLLRLQGFDETPTIFLNDFLAMLPKLTTLQLRNSCFETLFPSKGTPGNLDDKLSKKIKELWLYELENVKYILHEGLPLDLEGLYVNSCPSLISLVSSSTSFTNLTTLEVENCKEMIYLITSSTAKSLVQLRELKIRNCEKMLDVIKIDDDKTEESIIIFENLENMEFISLLSLRSFSNNEKQTFIFPSLVHFVVEGCPQMKNFSLGVTEAPYLTGILVEDGNKRWKDDLNATIQQLFIEKEAPHSNGTILSSYSQDDEIACEDGIDAESKE